MTLVWTGTRKEPGQDFETNLGELRMGNNEAFAYIEATPYWARTTTEPDGEGRNLVEVICYKAYSKSPPRTVRKFAQQVAELYFGKQPSTSKDNNTHA